MTKEDIIKEKIKIEMEKFKVYVFVVVALSSGLYVLLIRLEDTLLNKILFVVGFVFLVGFSLLIIRSYISISKYFKKLEKLIN
jgi:hypothetical protein